nr:MAG TPA: hypothetical protein [Caudoviricetes sp.]
MGNCYPSRLLSIKKSARLSPGFFIPAIPRASHAHITTQNLSG